MRDRDIRAVLIREVTAQHAGDPETLIIPELGLRQGHARIDLAVVNGLLHGFEIKSASDTLARLGGQAEAYSATCDRVTIIASTSHLDGIRRLVPQWWGITEAKRQDGAVVLLNRRQGRQNKNVDPFSLAQLLWRDEALQLLRDRAMDSGMTNKPRAKLWQKLASEIPQRELAYAVRTTLRARVGWRVDSRQALGGDLSRPFATS